jgi:hypothetical protein
LRGVAGDRQCSSLGGEGKEEENDVLRVASLEVSRDSEVDGVGRRGVKRDVRSEGPVC